MEGSSKLDNWLVSTGILVILIVLVVGLWMWLPWYLTQELKEVSQKALFGDVYGSVSALFTGLAFAGLIFTIILQQRQINLQREEFFRQLAEMKMSREEIARQVNVQEKHLELGLATLKMKSLETQIKEIELRGLQWMESARVTYIGSDIRKVRDEMDSIIEVLKRAIAS
jgi:hypothetical protein